MNYLGYPGTMGSDFIDYIIADQTLIPMSHRQDYSEKIIYLPNSYQPNDRSRGVSERIFTRKEAGLPADKFVFCCFNNNFKITPRVFDAWMRILKKADASVLWLFEDNTVAANNLRKEATSRGIDPQRLIFAQRMPMAEHLARQQLADLFLDTLPYNAHTTASDALWIGLPLLTQIGETFPGRVSASLLTALDLPELIASSEMQYENLAVELASNPAKHNAIREKLANHRLTKPLFDTALYTRHLERAYRAAYDRHHGGLPPDHIFVDP
jgi:predicted O-linked N-acetylglucosamine transferase (SPINDLY family)